MSSAENKSPRSPKASSSSKAKSSRVQTGAHTDLSPDLLPSVAQSPAEMTPAEPMDQHLDATLAPPAPPKPPEVMPSTVPDPVASAPNPAVSSTAPSGVSTAEPSAAEPDIAEPDIAEPGAESGAEPSGAEEQQVVSRQQPIPPASEPMQYRAIGLVRGRYVPSDEQFTRGNLHTDDGVAIDAVLLGRVMSLVKKHVDLEQSHLWVVYPRTREKEYDLHVQIVGVWEPESLTRLSDDEDSESESSDEAPTDEALTDEALAPEIAASEAPAAPEPQSMEAGQPSSQGAEQSTKLAKQPVKPAEPPVTTPPEANTPLPAEGDAEDFNDRYFSVRGEVVFHAPENEQVLVKIRRLPRPGEKQSKMFKVALKGVLEGKSVGYFWDFNVERQNNVLVVQEATLIKMVPPQKGDGRPKFSRRGPGGGSFGRKPFNRDGAAPVREGSPRPPRSSSDRPIKPTLQRNPVPRDRKEPLSKPVLKRREQDSSSS